MPPRTAGQPLSNTRSPRFIALTALALLLLLCLPQAAHANIALLWHAPFLSGNGYGQEAIEYVLGLDPLIRKRAAWLELRDDDPYDVSGELLEEDDYVADDAADANNNNKAAADDPIYRRQTKNIVTRLFAIQHADRPNYDAPAGWSPHVAEVMNTALLRRGTPPLASVSICHSEPGAWSVPEPLYETSVCPMPHSSVRIGRTMFETDRLPSGWETRLNEMHEVWVPSEFNKRTFIDGGVQPFRVVVVPEAIDTREWSRERIFKDLTAKNGGATARHPNRFLEHHHGEADKKKKTDKGNTNGDEKPPPNLFDMYPSSSWINKKCDIKFLAIFKWEHRKGWDVLLSAFYEEFVQDEAASRTASGQSAAEARRNPKHRDARTCLVVKASGYHSDIEDGDDEEYEDTIVSYIKKKYKKLATRMIIFSAHIPGSEFPLLYTGVDALVQPSRGEGWGRPHSEAMAMGTPVIATNWSGNTEYMRHEENALLIPIESELSEIEEGAFRGHRWAEPKKEELRRLMRRVADAVTVERKLSKLIPHLKRPVAEIQETDVQLLQTIRKTARDDMVTKYDTHVVAKTVLRRIDNLLRKKLYRPSVNEASHEPPPEEPEHAYDL